LSERKLVFIMLLSLVLSGLTVPMVFAPYRQVAFDKDEYAPGDSGHCTVELWMDTSDPTRDQEPRKYTKAELIFSFGTYTWTGEIILTPGDSTHKMITIDFSVPDGTSDGSYSPEVRLKYYVYRGGEWKGPYEDIPPTTSMTVKGTMIPGFPWESIVVGILIGTVAILLRKTTNFQSSKPSKTYSKTAQP